MFAQRGSSETGAANPREGTGAATVSSEDNPRIARNSSETALANTGACEAMSNPVFEWCGPYLSPSKHAGKSQRSVGGRLPVCKQVARCSEAYHCRARTALRLYTLQFTSVAVAVN